MGQGRAVSNGGKGHQKHHMTACCCDIARRFRLKMVQCPTLLKILGSVLIQTSRSALNIGTRAHSNKQILKDGLAGNQALLTDLKAA